jgi:hypothetical protein
MRYRPTVRDVPCLVRTKRLSDSAARTGSADESLGALGELCGAGRRAEEVGAVFEHEPADGVLGFGCDADGRCSSSGKVNLSSVWPVGSVDE